VRRPERRLEASVHLAAWANITDIDDVLVAIDGEDDTQGSHARASTSSTALQRFGVLAKRVVGDLSEAFEDAGLHIARQAFDIVLG
jgi:hypothetical protein